MRLTFSASKTWFSISFWVLSLVLRQRWEELSLLPFNGKLMHKIIVYPGYSTSIILCGFYCLLTSTENPVVTTQWPSGFFPGSGKVPQEGLYLAQKWKIKSLNLPPSKKPQTVHRHTHKKIKCLLSQKKLFLIQHTHVHPCALSSTEKENDNNESSREEKRKCAICHQLCETSASLCTYWRYYKVFDL